MAYNALYLIAVQNIYEYFLAVFFYIYRLKNTLK